MTITTSNPTPEERSEQGKLARDRVPRSGHAHYEPAADRPDPVDVLERQAVTRVPELVPIRYGRMLESPFRFYRGAAAVMASDLGTLPDTGLTVQACGDAHLLNFGLFASPERHLVFDVNDFDETLPGPWEWDLKRLAASLAIAGRENGFPGRRRDEIVRSCVRGYRMRMRAFAQMRTLDIWYAQDDVDSLSPLLAKGGGGTRRRAAEAAAKARRRTGLQAFEKLTRVVDGERRIAPDPPLITPLRDLLPGAEGADFGKVLGDLIEDYAQTLASDRRHLLGRYRLVDMARKVVGVGSVGTRCWIVLLLGRDDGDPLLLQAKEAGESVLAPYAGPSAYANQGERVVSGQRLMQASSDIFLGWQTVTGLDGLRRDFYVRQLRDWKGSVRPETMSPTVMERFGHQCGSSLARAHARSGDPVALAAYLGSGDNLDRALALFAESYADQNEQDHRALVEAARSGRITVQSA